MISEGQAKTLVEECERVLGRPLKSLRDQLRASEDTLGALWELITLHTALQFGKGVDHEPTTGRPDVLVDVPPLGRFWIEATHVRWPTRDASIAIQQFIDWTMREIGRLGIRPTEYNIHVDPLPGERNAVLAPHQAWAALRRTAEWHDFLARVQTRPRSPVLTTLPQPFSACFTTEFFSEPQRFVHSGYRSPTIVNPISNHPLYRAIFSKADQARRWKLGEPIVVCVGSSLSTSLFRSVQNGVPTAEAVVAAALRKSSEWSFVDRYNILRDTSATDYQVRGSDRISGVLLVSIETPSNGWRTNDHQRVAERKLMANSEARFPLTQEQTQALASLNFNTFPYGPQWETWNAPSSRQWNEEERIMTRSGPGGHFVWAPRDDGRFELQIPAENLTRILLGVDSADALRSQLKDLIPRKPGLLLPSLESAEMIPGNAKLRQPSMLKLTFGLPEPPTLQGLSKGKIRRRNPSPA